MKRAWLWVSLLIVVLAAAAAAVWWFVYRPQAEVTPCTGVTVYADADYAGASACFPAGKYNAAALSTKGISDNSISSIKVGSGYRVTVYLDDSFRDLNKVFTADVSDLSKVTDSFLALTHRTWDNQISSIEVTAVPVCATVTEVAVYSDSDFGGDSACLPVGEYDAAALSLKGINNDRISSIKIKSGFKAIAFIDDNFHAGSEEFTADILNLNDITTLTDPFVGDWNDKISSIKVETAPACAVAVYNYANYGSWGACLAVGDYTKAALEAKNVPDNTIASIKVNAGFKATVYVNDNYLGNSFEFTADAVNLDFVPGGGESRWDDKISSIKVAAVGTPPPPSSSVTLTASDTDIDSGDSVTLTWTLVNLVASTCTGAPSGWFVANSSLTGTATVTPTDDTTYKLTCGAYSDQVVINILSGDEDTCTAPLTETRTQSCPSGQTGSITQTRTKGDAPDCDWGEWTTTTNTCTTAVAVTPTPTPTPTATATPTATPAATGPETPLVAGGLLSLVFGAYYWLRRKE